MQLRSMIATAGPSPNPVLERARGYLGSGAFGAAGYAALRAVEARGMVDPGAVLRALAPSARWSAGGAAWTEARDLFRRGGAAGADSDAIEDLARAAAARVGVPSSDEAWCIATMSACCTPHARSILGPRIEGALRSMEDADDPRLAARAELLGAALPLDVTRARVGARTASDPAEIVGVAEDEALALGYGLDWRNTMRPEFRSHRAAYPRLLLRFGADSTPLLRALADAAVEGSGALFFPESLVPAAVAAAQHSRDPVRAAEYAAELLAALAAVAGPAPLLPSTLAALRAVAGANAAAFAAMHDALVGPATGPRGGAAYCDADRRAAGAVRALASEDPAVAAAAAEWLAGATVWRPPDDEGGDEDGIFDRGAAIALELVEALDAGLVRHAALALRRFGTASPAGRALVPLLAYAARPAGAYDTCPTVRTATRAALREIGLGAIVRQAGFDAASVRGRWIADLLPEDPAAELDAAALGRLLERVRGSPEAEVRAAALEDGLLAEAADALYLAGPPGDEALVRDLLAGASEGYVEVAVDAAGLYDLVHAGHAELWEWILDLYRPRRD